MEEVLKQLSLYDLFGYLVPGAVAVWAVMTAVAACARSEAQAAPPAINTAIFKWHNAALLVLLLVGSGISYGRYTAFDGYFVDHTYRAFYVDYKLSKPEAGKSPEAAKGRGKKK